MQIMYSCAYVRVVSPYLIMNVSWPHMQNENLRRNFRLKEINVTARDSDNSYV